MLWRKKIIIEAEREKKRPCGKEFKERKMAGLYFYGVVLLAELCRNKKRRFRKMQNMIKRLSQLDDVTGKKESYDWDSLDPPNLVAKGG